MLRDYQQSLVTLSCATPGNVLIQADTGSGKTRVLAEIAKIHQQVICIAHRNILIKQSSRELARFNIKHEVIATTHTRRLCMTEHRRIGGNWLGKSSKWVSSIDSLLSRQRRGLLTLDTQAAWLIIVDEAHHMIDDNKWGKLTEIFPNARIIGATATPCRLDQVSLARGHGGVFDALIQAPELQQDSVKTLIKQGYLSDFKAYSLPERIDSRKLMLGQHDYTYKSLIEATNEVQFEMAGDAVKHYKRLASGKQALVFCVNIDIAKETAKHFKASGIASASIHSKMGSAEVARVFDLFERRVIQVLCNVDMIGEGVDIPAIEALIMLRKTASFGLYRQWCGRSLRPESGKDHAILIDHVGNILTHGLPDQHISWNLNNPPQAKKSNLMPCPKCLLIMHAWLLTCPECGAVISRASVGYGQANVRYIDVNLVLMKRDTIDRELRENTVLDIRECAERLAPGVLGDAIHQIRLWFADSLSDQLSIKALNDFFKATARATFWMDNFRWQDVKTKNVDKCLTVYTAWKNQ